MIEIPIGWFITLCCLSFLGTILLSIMVYFLVIYPICDMIKNYKFYKEQYEQAQIKRAYELMKEHEQEKEVEEDEI